MVSINFDIDNTPLTFGKHKGKTPNEILESDTSYIVWMWGNMDKPPCSMDLYELACEEVESGVDEGDRWSTF